MKNISRIIIFRPGALGDLLIAAPVIWRLIEINPSCIIEYLAEDNSSKLIISANEAASLIPEISKTYLYNKNSSFFDRLKSIKHRINPKRGDILLYLCYKRSSLFQVFRDLFFFYLVGFRNFVGFLPAMRDCFVKNPYENEYNRLIRWS